jgi:hypothetical protein
MKTLCILIETFWGKVVAGQGGQLLVCERLHGVPGPIWGFKLLTLEALLDDNTNFCTRINILITGLSQASFSFTAGFRHKLTLTVGLWTTGVAGELRDPLAPLFVKHARDH